ncbi:MAG: D-galactarolactone cycloisomerase [Parasphingorhabdus sp.]
MPKLVATSYENVDLSLEITQIETIVVRAPIDIPVRTSFGVMKDRPAVFLRVTDSNGNIGVGEIWCNFPGCGAEHRANLVNAELAHHIVGSVFSDPQDCFSQLQSKLKRLAIQSGESGPIAQCIAGVDIALWDLVARSLSLPLYRLLGGSQACIPVYASGINPNNPVATVNNCRQSGHKAFKLKIGFGEDIDLVNLDGICASLGSDESLFVDANQAWSKAQAISQLSQLQEFPLGWLEEPLLADSATEDWNQLHDQSRIPIAAGENIIGQDRFVQAIASNWLDVLQPDVCKWGGVSGILPIARRALDRGKRYCPHYLGGGIGLAASAHLLAAVGGDGLLEVDVNPNPLRDDLYPLVVENGTTCISQDSGIGINPDMLTEISARFSGSSKPLTS